MKKLMSYNNEMNKRVNTIDDYDDYDDYDDHSSILTDMDLARLKVN